MGNPIFSGSICAKPKLKWPICAPLISFSGSICSIESIQGLKLHLDYSETPRHMRGSDSGNLDYAQADAWASAYKGVAAGVALVVGLGFFAFLRKAGN